MQFLFLELLSCGFVSALSVCFFISLVELSHSHWQILLHFLEKRRHFVLLAHLFNQGS